MIGETYAIGIDFGTDSGRAVLVHTGTGEEVADHVYTYPHGVITEQLPEEGVPLQQDWALQHPEDYIGVLTLLMQIFADVTGMNIRIATSVRTSALGAAILGTAAAGTENRGYSSITEAVQYMARVQQDSVEPLPEHRQRYAELYELYRKLYNYFGREDSTVMKILKHIRQDQRDSFVRRKEVVK